MEHELFDEQDLQEFNEWLESQQLTEEDVDSLALIHGANAG
jgi:hypothetical protein